MELFSEAEAARLPPPTMRAIAESLDLSLGTITDHIKRMVRDQWLEQPDGHNKYRTTDRGREMLRRIRAAESRKKSRGRSKSAPS